MFGNFVYPVAARALQKWKDSNLDIVGQSNGTAHFRFLFNGSTCNDGGTPFKAFLHAKLDISPPNQSDPKIINARIEIPEGELEAARIMCGYRDRGDSFWATLSEFPAMQGKSITEILSEDVSMNHAGCFCTMPMVNQKWRIALSTIHFAINSE